MPTSANLTSDGLSGCDLAGRASRPRLSGGGESALREPEERKPGARDSRQQRRHLPVRVASASTRWSWSWPAWHSLRRTPRTATFCARRAARRLWACSCSTSSTGSQSRAAVRGSVARGRLSYSIGRLRHQAARSDGNAEGKFMQLSYELQQLRGPTWLRDYRVGVSRSSKHGVRRR